MKYNNESILQVKDVCWYTNLRIKQKDDYIFKCNYKGREDNYPKYDNYNAINIDKVREIPGDYYDEMGVPISFLSQINFDQFKIIGICINPVDFGGKIYKNGQIIYSNGKSKRRSSLSYSLTINYDKLKNNELKKRYHNKTKYRADNSDGLLIVPYARIIIKRIEK